MTFAGLVSTLLTLQLPPDQVDSIIPVLADAFGLPEDIRAFLVEKYLPEVKDYFSFLLPSLFFLNATARLTQYKTQQHCVA